MPWILFAFAIACFTVAIYTHSMGLALLCLMAALGLMLAGALSIVSARIQRSSSNSGMQLNPALERHRIKQSGQPTAAAGSLQAEPASAESGQPAEETGQSAVTPTESQHKDAQA